MRLTADFSYIRLHGPGRPYQGSYSDEVLAGWAARLLDWTAAGIPVYCYFDNDRGYAAGDARRLACLVGCPGDPARRSSASLETGPL